MPGVQENTAKKNIAIPAGTIEEHKEDISFSHRMMILGVSLAIFATGMYLKFRKDRNKKKAKVSRKPVQEWLKKALTAG